MNSLVKARSGIVACVVTIFLGACIGPPEHAIPSFFKEVPDMLRDSDAKVELLDKHGKSLSSFNDSFTLGAADAMKYNGVSYKTPSAEEKETLEKLEKTVEIEAKPPMILKLKLPVSGKTATVVASSVKELASGELLICGGFLQDKNEEKVLDSTWILDPQTHRIREGTRMAVPRSAPELTVLNDAKVLITGGYGKPGYKSVLRLIELLDAKTGKISSCGNMCIPRVHHAVVQLKNGTVLVFGGDTEKELSDADDQMSSTIEELNISKKQARFVGKMLMARLRPIAVPIGTNEALVAGGWYVTGLMGDVRWWRGAEIYRLSE